MPEEQVFIQLIPSSNSALCNKAGYALQEKVKTKSVKSPCRLYYQGNSSQVIFRHGTQFFGGCSYNARWVEVSAWAIDPPSKPLLLNREKRDIQLAQNKQQSMIFLHEVHCTEATIGTWRSE